MNTPTLAAAFFCLAVLSACTSPPADVAPPPTLQEIREVRFDCSHGESLTVRFSSPPGVALLMRNGQSTELPQQPSGSGFVYSNGRNTLRGKGDDLTVEIGRMAPLQCKARR